MIMNIVVIGLGSMGKRRIRLLKQYIGREVDNKCAWNIIGVDSNAERCRESSTLYDIATYASLNNALKTETIDCAVISTSPHTHATIIRECLQHKLHVFTELNLISDGYEDNIALSKKKEKVLFLSSTFMYRKEMQYIKEKVQTSQFKGLYRYHIGQYLPEWHPWENYKNFFAGRKDTNGCREIFAIELPWLTDTFGEIVAVHSLHRKVSDLKIDYDDSYHVLVEHASGVMGNLSVDIVTPKAGRELEIWAEGFYLGWKGTPDTLTEFDNSTGSTKNISLYEQVEHKEGYNQFIVENAYYDELVNFIHSVQQKEQPRYSFEQDSKILAWIDEIEK